MTTPAPPPPAQLTDVLAALRRHWRVVAVTTVVGAVLGVVAALVIPASYTAESVVSVNPMNANPLTSNSGGSSVNMPTEEQVVASASVAGAAAELLAPRYAYSSREVQDATSVTTPDESQVLSISFTASTAKQAAAGATAVSEAYLAQRREGATDELDRLQKAARDQITELQTQSNATRDAIARRTIAVQVEALATQLAQLGSVDLNPGEVVGAAETPTSPSGPGPLPLGAGGAFLGLLVGIPLALTRRDDDSEIGSAEGLSALGDHVVLDGTRDSNRADTWDIAAFMLKVPEQPGDEAFVIMVDAADDPTRVVDPGQELVDAFARRGQTARFVDAAGVDEARVNQGWPADERRTTWLGELVVVDTTAVLNDTNKVALATHSDAVVVARSTTDDAAALRRLAGMMSAKNADITMSALFPPRPELKLD